jgi:hypothetical protein
MLLSLFPFAKNQLELKFNISDCLTCTKIKGHSLVYNIHSHIFSLHLISSRKFRSQCCKSFLPFFATSPLPLSKTELLPSTGTWSEDD